MLNHLQNRRPLPALTRLALGALLIDTLAYALEFIGLGIDREIIIIVGLLFLASLLVATGGRWTPAFGVLLASGIVLGNPFLQYNLSKPITSIFFLAALLQVISTFVIVLAGIGATIQNYRQRG